MSFEPNIVEMKKKAAEMAPPEPEEKQKRPLLSDADFAPLDTWLNEAPPEREYIVEGWIPVDITAAVTATGGTGKSNLIQLICACVAAGVSIGPIKVSRPRVVLLINVEESKADLWRRIYALGQVHPIFKDRLHLLKQNLKLYPGRGLIKPFMRLDSGVPLMTDDGLWMANSMRELRPELAVFDTKSRLFGLEENSNDHAAQWWGVFERLITEIDNGLTAMVASHTSKAGANTTTASARGAQAFIDNARLNIVLSNMSEKEGQLHDVDESEYYSLSIPKANYNKTKYGVWFRKTDKEGVPEPAELEKERFYNAAKLLADLISKAKKVKKRDLEQRGDGEAKEIRQKIKSEYGFAKRDIGPMIMAALREGWINEHVDRKGAIWLIPPHNPYEHMHRT